MQTPWYPCSVDHCGSLTSSQRRLLPSTVIDPSSVRLRRFFCPCISNPIVVTKEFAKSAFRFQSIFACARAPVGGEILAFSCQLPDWGQYSQNTNFQAIQVNERLSLISTFEPRPTEWLGCLVRISPTTLPITGTIASCRNLRRTAPNSEARRDVSEMTDDQIPLRIVIQQLGVSAVPG